jgi:hypothetical protein
VANLPFGWLPTPDGYRRADGQVVGGNGTGSWSTLPDGTHLHAWLADYSMDGPVRGDVAAVMALVDELLPLEYHRA